MNGFRLIRQAASYGGLLNSHHHLPATVQLAINRKYSNALQTAAIKPDKLELLEDDLKRIAVAIDADSQFKDLILSNTANLVEKKSCINRMLNDQLAANDLTVRLVNSMIEKDLLRLLLTNDLQKTVSKLRAVINDLNETANSKGAGGAHTDFDSVGEFVRQIERVLQNYGRESSTSSIADAQQTALVAKELADLQFKSADPVMNQNLMSSWLKLSKYRLTSLVLVTTLAGHYMGVSAFDPQLMFFTLLGTGLCSSSAAALNQFLEIPYDSQMSRTKSRPLVAHSVTPLHAFTFAAVTGLSGVALLAANVNTLTASLGALNLILYSFIYTPMKRFNIANTWIGSIVGAIPPVMGYAAATGGIDLAAVSLGLLLYSWQFPHFNALSWNIKHDYARAGYRMMVVTNPELCVRTAFRHSWLIALYCELMCTDLIGLNNWAFGAVSLPINLYLIHLAWKFKQNPNAKTSRTLFRFSLYHLPLLLLLVVATKKSKKNNNSKNSNTIESIAETSR